MREQRLLGTVERRYLRQRRMQREHVAKLGPVQQIGGQITAQPGVGRVTGRGEGGEAICRAALDHEDQSALGRGPGKGNARGQQRSSAAAIGAGR